MTIRIPAGVDTGSRLRSAGNGESGLRGGPSGSLYVVLHVRSHEILQREGDDLMCEVPISFVQATLGTELEVPTLTGGAQIRVPPGTQSGTVFRIKGKGVKHVQGHGIGDLLIKNVAERLRLCLRTRTRDAGDRVIEPDMVIGRFGGDEFNLLMRQLRSPQDATKVAQRILEPKEAHLACSEARGRWGGYVAPNA